MGREINSSRIDVERNIDFFFRKETHLPSNTSFLFLLQFRCYQFYVLHRRLLTLSLCIYEIRIVRLELFLEYLSFVFIISFFFSTNMVKATRIAGPLFDLSHFSWRRSRSEMVKIIHERVYCYSSSRILERGLKIDSTFNVSKVHPSPFIQTRPSSKLVFDAMLNSDLFSLSLSPRPAHVPPTEIMKSETQGT